MNRIKLISIVFSLSAILVCAYYFLKKETIYIHLENIETYTYKFIEGDSIKPKKIRIQQKGDSWYKSWELDLNYAKFKQVNSEQLNKINIVSQYWIVNNLNGFSIGFDFSKTKRYNLNIVKFDGEKTWIYPVKEIHFITE